MILTYELLKMMCIIAQRAGDAIISVKSKPQTMESTTKNDGSPVTTADLRAHEIILDSLRLISEDVPILSEEGIVGDPASQDYCFVVDPLDGTKEFIKGSNMYTVNIGVARRDGKSSWSPACGVVCAPELQQTWFGGQDLGAFLSDQNGIREISVSTDREIPVIVGSISHSTPQDRRFAKSVGRHVFEGVGSSIKLCRVSDGSADMSPRFGPTSCWDTLAAHAILCAAGGNLLGPDCKELTYDIDGNIINPPFFATSNGRWVDQWKREVLKE